MVPGEQEAIKANMAEGEEIIGLHPIKADDIKKHLEAASLPPTTTTVLLRDETYLLHHQLAAIDFIRSRMGLTYSITSLKDAFIVREKLAVLFVKIGKAECKRLWDRYTALPSQKKHGWKLQQFFPLVSRDRVRALEKKLGTLSSINGSV